MLHLLLKKLFRLKRASLACLSALLLAQSVSASEPCAPTRSSLIVDPRAIVDSMGAIEKIRLSGSEQEGCFKELTTEDKAFLRKLGPRLLAACQSDPCGDARKKAFFDAFDEYGKQAGSVARERVRIALQAQIQAQQVHDALQILHNPEKYPKLAAEFSAFSQAMLRYEKALSAASHSEIQPHDPESTLSIAITRIHQWKRINEDALWAPVDRLTRSENPRIEQERANLAFLMRAASLNKAVKEIGLPAEEEDRFLKTIQALHAELGNRTIEVNDRSNETTRNLQLGVATLSATGLVVASFATIAPAVAAGAGGEVLSAGGVGMLSGATGSAGATGAAKIIEFTQKARADADARATSLACELSRRVGSEGKEALKEVWNAAEAGALFGGGMGSSLATVARFAPRVTLIAAAAGSLAGSGALLQSAHNTISSTLTAHQALQYARKDFANGLITEGELQDAKHAYDLTIANLSGQPVEQSMMVGSLLSSARQLYRTPHGDKYRSSIKPKDEHPPSAEALAAREELLKQFAVFEKIDSKDNGNFIQLVRGMLKNRGPPGNDYTFFDTEMAILKLLNDKILKDKDLATAVTNLYKDKVYSAIMADPVLKQHLVSKYSDYKSLRLAFDAPSDKIQSRLTAAYEKARSEFAREMQNTEIAGKVKGFKNWISNAANWNLAGIGRTADEAGFASRFARKMKDDRIPIQKFETIAGHGAEYQGMVATIRQKFQKALGSDPQAQRLFIQDGDDIVLSPEAIDVIRKTTPPTRGTDSDFATLVRKEIESRLKVKISDRNAQTLLDYIHETDLFMPGIYVDERVVIPIEHAEHGIISADFTGQNAENIHHTMLALLEAERNQLPLSKTLDLSREGEIKATESLNAKKAAFAQSLDQTFGQSEKPPLYFSGDDGNYFPAKDAMHPETNQTLMNTIHEAEKIGMPRIVFLPPKDTAGNRIDKDQINRLLPYSESFEKDMRKESEKGFKGPTIRKFFIGVVPEVVPQGNPGQVAVGKFDLVVSGELSPQDQKVIQQQFEKQAKARGVVPGQIHFVKPEAEAAPAQPERRAPAPPPALSP